MSTLVVLGIVSLSIVFFPKPKPKQAVTPVAQKSTPTPTPKVLDRSKLVIHIFNGSGQTGASKKASVLLEPLGYNVVELSNAKTFKYKQTEIRIKQSKIEYLEQLKKDLSAQYEIGSASADLSESDRDDAQIIVGEK